MFKVEVGKVLKDFHGTPIINQSTTPMAAMTVKDVFLTHLGLWTPRDGQKHIRAYALGIKLVYEPNETIFLEDAEMELLKESMAEPKTAVMVYAPAKEALDSATKGTGTLQ